jgi:hypothetical protein
VRICLSGIFYPFAILSYFKAALSRRDDVELFTVGPYTGCWIPWGGGMNLPQKYVARPDMALPNAATFKSLPTPFVEAKLRARGFVPDLWLQVDAGFHLAGKPTRGKNVIVATDPHVLNYDRQRGFADTFYCMQQTYAKSGDEYLPYAFDPVWHAPEEQPRMFDVCLLGLHYPQRNELVGRLRDLGVNVHYDLGPVYDEARALYNQAPVGLNWSSLLDLNARCFELLGMGRLAVVNGVPDLPKFFTDGRDLVVFNTMEEAVEKVTYYLEHTDEAAKIATWGHRTVQPHTWDARVARILRGL